MKVGKAIKELRIQKGFKSQKSLAEASGIPVTTLCQIELDKAFPQKETIQKICETLGVPSSYLLLFALTEEDVPEERRAAFKALNESMKSLLVS